MNYPKVSIIILNWNGIEDTTECLNSLREITYPDYEVIVVDNASEGDDVRILKENFDDYIHVIENDKNFGFAEGCNIGMRYALSGGTDYVLLLNNDTTVASDFLTEMISVGESDESIGILGPKIYFYDQPDIIWEAGGKINWWLGSIEVCAYGEVDIAQRDKITETDLVSGAAMLIKTGIINRISLLDSSFFLGFEDYDYCIRARKAGFKVVYVPSANIWHKVGRARSKLLDFPETQRQVITGIGIFGAKIRWNLFRKYATIPPFPIPIILYFLLYWPIKGIQLLILRRDVKSLADLSRGILREISGYLKAIPGRKQRP